MSSVLGGDWSVGPPLRYETVHPMATEGELRRRLQPEDRRVYAFFHPATADVPLIFVEVALVRGADGVVPGDRVAMQVPKSPEAIALYLVTLQIGGVFLPLNTAYTGAEMRYFLGDAQPRALVCAPERRADYADAQLNSVFEKNALLVAFVTRGWAVCSARRCST
jgi:hypothetical protein